MSALATALALFASSIVPPSPAWVTIPTSELRERYDTIWAVSDVHGHREELEQLLLAAGLATRAGPGDVRWNAARPRQLLVVLGDLIDGGPDSPGVVLLLDHLAAQAGAAGSRVVVLLGNHEARFLARKRNRSSKTEMSRFLLTLPAAAFIGTWLFAHAGYIDAGADETALRAYFDRLAADWDEGGNKRYRPLLGARSILEYHGWWAARDRRSAMKERLSALGLDGLVFGHDPGALGARRTIAMDRDGWLIKLDSGMKEDRSPGMLLRCEVARIVRQPGMHACGVSLPDGSVRELPVR
jgi:hypothetical protein